MGFQIILSPQNKGVPGVNGDQPSAATITVAQQVTLYNQLVLQPYELVRQEPELITPALVPTTSFNGFQHYTPPGTLVQGVKFWSTAVYYNLPGSTVEVYVYSALRNLFWRKGTIYNLNQLVGADFVPGGASGDTLARAVLAQMWPVFVTLGGRIASAVQQQWGAD